MPLLNPHKSIMNFIAIMYASNIIRNDIISMHFNYGLIYSITDIARKAKHNQYS